MGSFFDYRLDKNKRLTLRPKRWHLVPLFIGVVVVYFIILSFYIQKQKQLTFQMANSSMNYIQSLIVDLGPVTSKNNKLYAGEYLLNRSTELVDSVQKVTGFGCTIFNKDIRIATTVFTHDSTSRVIGTKTNEEVVNRVLMGGKTFEGVTTTLGKKWIIIYCPLRDVDDRIVGMIATFQEEQFFNDGMLHFKIILGAVLLFLCLLVMLTVELTLRWSRLIENQHFVLSEKNMQLSLISEELKMSYASLKSSEEKFRDFFENSYDLIQSVDLNGKFLYVNSSWLQTLGYEHHEILKLTTTDIVHPDYHDQYNELTERAKFGDEIMSADMVFLTKERDAILLNGNIHCEFKEEVPIAVRGVFRNDTNRKLAQKKLEESEKQYRFLVESADDLIFRTDYKGNIIYANSVVMKLTGYTTEEFFEKNYLDIVRKEHREQVIDFYRKQFTNRLEVSYFEFQITKKNGDMVWLGQNVTTLFKDADKNWVEGYFAVSRDISDRKHKEGQINFQNKQLEDQNRSIKESIRYAKRIQDSILPNEKELNEIFPESFVVYQPKDIVSGDFYWISKRENKLFVVVADCTGHGVPAAFMSIIGSDQLNTAINRKGLDDPADILEQISKGFRRVLKRPMDDIEIQDGMDLAICAIDLNTNKLKFSGAFNDLYLIRSEELIKYRGTRVSVGMDEKIYRLDDEYKQHSFKIKKNDMIYLFTDGYPDQFGGAKNRKMGYERFRQILLKIHKESMIDQKKLLTESMLEWRSGEEQIDDICVLGIRF